MLFQRLRIQTLRCLTELELELGPGINVFSGENGAGKTSILEAAFLLSHGRSFRSNARDALMQREAKSLSVFAELSRKDGSVTRLGLGREAGRWQARVDMQACALGQLVSRCAVVCFEPGSHALIAGAAEERRRYLDWGVFHVEPSFLEAWRRYQRALKQRNALLRQQAPFVDELFEPWEEELASTASAIDGYRRDYLGALAPHLQTTLNFLLPELGRVSLTYRRGWSADASLLETFSEDRLRDRARGHTVHGTHRADWAIHFEHAPLREHLSRGQEKLTALACMLAQASLYQDRSGEWPVICLDDLASELDKGHQSAVIDRLVASGAQVFITGTHSLQGLNNANARLFHVEQGRAAALL